MDIQNRGIIWFGDIHAHFKEWHDLARYYGFEYDPVENVFSHPKGYLMGIIGDFTDRGPDNKKVIDALRKMTAPDRRSAIVLLGNHEINNVHMFTTNPLTRGYLRPWIRRNLRQNETFRTEKDRDVNKLWWWETLEWMKTLPIYCDMGRVKAIHACYWPSAIEYLQDNDFKFMTRDGCLTTEGWQARSDPASMAHRAISILTTGLDIPLPSGHTIMDNQREPRRAERWAHWKENPLTYGELYVNGFREPWADTLIPEGFSLPATAQLIRSDIDTRLGADEKVLFGHFGLRSEHPAPLSDQFTCLCFGIYRPTGKLAAISIIPDQEDRFAYITRDGRIVSLDNAQRRGPLPGTGPLRAAHY
jgi:hypothetical protein